MAMYEAKVSPQYSFNEQVHHVVYMRHLFMQRVTQTETKSKVGLLKLIKFIKYLLGITFPSGERQAQLLEEVYREAGIDPAQVNYVETHGTGTKVGDPQEANAICDIFCRD